MTDIKINDIIIYEFLKSMKKEESNLKGFFEKKEGVIKMHVGLSLKIPTVQYGSAEVLANLSAESYEDLTDEQIKEKMDNMYSIISQSSKKAAKVEVENFGEFN